MNALTPSQAADELVGAGLPVELAERVAPGLATLAKLDDVIAAAQRCRGKAARGNLFVSWQGQVLIRRLRDLLEVDDLSMLAADFAIATGKEADGTPIDFGGRA